MDVVEVGSLDHVGSIGKVLYFQAGPRINNMLKWTIDVKTGLVMT